MKGIEKCKFKLQIDGDKVENGSEINDKDGNKEQYRYNSKDSTKLTQP
jgi:hypothetical protein